MMIETRVIVRNGKYIPQRKVYFFFWTDLFFYKNSICKSSHSTMEYAKNKIKEYECVIWKKL